MSAGVQVSMVVSVLFHVCNRSAVIFVLMKQHSYGTKEDPRLGSPSNPPTLQPVTWIKHLAQVMRGEKQANLTIH